MEEDSMGLGFTLLVDPGGSKETLAREKRAEEFTFEAKARGLRFNALANLLKGSQGKEAMEENEKGLNQSVGRENHEENQ
ncbi:hypothetical protein Nepgr_016332 [Nepenthes gracilis]|uniref:Uncharacterized protein n=1 Tax=Nepenthes gracilis TaxID=150966 RepID=A0AAD3XS70_NEPGR|nr:hypothetical protein Nepgr_016332 [Nepenthes gracilis]